MDLKDVQRLLHEHEAELKEIGTQNLALFGSIVRGEAHPDSDIDVLVEFSGPVTFDRYMELKFFLEDLLGCKVDLVLRDTLKPRLRERILAEAVYA